MLGFDCSYKKGDATNGKIGNYDITPKGLAAGNYVITFVKGTLTVKEKALTATEEGIMTYTCTTCGNVFTQPIVKIASATGTSGSRKNTNSQNNSDTETKPYIKDDSGKEGWNVISSQLDEAKSIPVDVINNVTGERYSMNLSLAYDGEFGFTATLIINMESRNAGLYANLFCYNEQTGELEFVSAGQIDADGNAELEFTHASDYTIVIDEAVMDGGNKDSINTTKDNGNAEDNTTIPASNAYHAKSDAWNPAIIIIIGICILLIVSGTVIFVRKKNGSEEE